MAEDSYGLSLVVPCFNEEARLPRFGDSWKEFTLDHREELQESFGNWELVLVDDGSSDKTFKEMEKLAKEFSFVRLFRLDRNQGKGAAVKKGMEAATGQWVLITDVDLSTPLSELFKLKKQNVDLAFGSRAIKDSDVQIKQRGLRPWLGRAFNSFVRLLTGLPYYDTQCGFKLIEGDLAREVGKQMQEKRFAFDVEILLLASQRGASIQEVPVIWRHQEPSRVSTWRDGPQMVWKVWQIRRQFRKVPIDASKSQSPQNNL